MAEEKVTNEQMARDLISMLAAFDIEFTKARSIMTLASDLLGIMPEHNYKQLGTGISLFMKPVEGSEQ